MEYNQKICLERVEFHDLLASGHDCATYLNFSLFFATLLGFSFLGGVHYCLSLQNEIDGLVQVKKSLMEHIYSLEEELRAKYTEDEQEQEQEELDDLADDKKPHTD
jgi:hypothetical protein